MGSKIDRLRALLDAIGSGVVAFSGGTDSTFLLHMAYDQLGDQVVALTVASPVFPERELKEAQVLASCMGVRHYIRSSNEWSDPRITQNSRDRCYHCKREIIRLCKDLAQELGLSQVLEGSNSTDLQDHRPGLLALEEGGVRSPLREADMTKEEIRRWSKERGLPTWNKASQACLASRFPYGIRIDGALLRQVERSEALLKDMGFHQVRVRYHRDVARIEIEKEEISRFIDPVLRDRVVQALRGFGFTYVSLDLEGYRTGSLNEGIGSEPI